MIMTLEDYFEKRIELLKDIFSGMDDYKLEKAFRELSCITKDLFKIKDVLEEEDRYVQEAYASISTIKENVAQGILEIEKLKEEIRRTYISAYDNIGVSRDKKKGEQIK